MSAWQRIGLTLTLIALPIVGRWITLHPGRYVPPELPAVEDVEIAVPEIEYQPLRGEPQAGRGRVVFDLSHDNNLEVDDLTPLRDRLIARGVEVETFTGFDVSLEAQLRGATALVVIAPTFRYSAQDREAVVEFVADGGRLLLAADPTRPIPPFDESDLYAILFPESAIPAINSLASAFGVVYFNDYLYNLVRNQGNYRNIIFSGLDPDQPLTHGLEEIVFFAAHSLRTEGVPLIWADRNTHSSLRTGETRLTAAALAAEGRVLALGDVTVLTAPYHSLADNDGFLTNIADWLTAADRDFDLRDFPFVFSRPVDLVQIAGKTLDSRLIARADLWQAAFEQADLTLDLRASGDPAHDLLLVGTFADAEFVENYLTTAGVSISVAGDGEIEIQGLGTMGFAGNTLFVLDRGAERVAVIALAEDGQSALQALDRLATADFSGCVHTRAVTVCSKGEGEGLGTGGEPRVSPTPGLAPAGAPRIGSPAESEAALQAGTPRLEDLAPETYETNSQAGETYTYTISMDGSQDALWMYGWCTTTQELLEQNWENISLSFILDGQEVQLERFVRFDTPPDVLACRIYYTLLTDWPRGQHLVITHVTFETAINDGLDDYPAGTHTFEYRVQVGG